MLIADNDNYRFKRSWLVVVLFVVAVFSAIAILEMRFAEIDQDYREEVGV